MASREYAAQMGKNLIKSARPADKPHHLRLERLPFSAKPSDIYTALSRAHIRPSHVALEYFDFIPTGRALLSFQNMAQAAEGLRAMRSMNIGGIEVRASYAKPYTAQTPRRTRGAEGRQELADKGHLGNGPDAGITSAMRGRTVVIDGLPLRRTAEEFLRKLSTTHGMHLRPSTGDVDMTYLQVPPGQWQNRTSRYLVVMKDAVEAHRIVRELHWTEHAFDDRTYTLTLHIVH